MHAGIVREEESLNEGIEKLKNLSERAENAKATGDRLIIQAGIFVLI